MSYARRTNDRRRRTLYSAHQADQFPATAASRLEAERLREARRPTAAYGSRVQRRLRGRWFSLVPVRRRTIATVSGVLVALAVLLCGAHYAAVAWPAIAYRPEIARPLRLDRADSFGRWFIVAMLTGSAGVSLLIYQLRRYRIDDYQGHYRLWRWVLIVMLIASVNSLVSIIDWGGALLDAGFGKRVALTGADWIRLVVSLGGAVLALRLVAEVRRSRLALGMMILACLMMVIPEAAKWKFLEVESLGKWAAVTSAPLMACTAMFISLGGYLRMLYREVRQIDERDSLMERFQQMRLRVFKRSDDVQADAPADQQIPPRNDRDPHRSRLATPQIKPTSQPQRESATQRDAGEGSTPRAKRRWLGLRRAKDPQPARLNEKDDPSVVDATTKRPLSFRPTPPAPDKAPSPTDASRPAAVEEASPSSAKRRGLGGWLRRDKGGEEESTHPPNLNRKEAAPADAARQTDTDDTDPIEWDSLSKAERRRLRKQLKRQTRAA